MRSLRIVAPCRESWSAMRGEGDVRHCDACDKEVVDLTAASEAEARARLDATRARCVRMRVDARGAPLFAAALAVAVAACGAHEPAPPRTVANRCSAPPPRPRPPAWEDAGLPSDTDGDGLPDALDACPGAPGPADPDPRNNGCPSDRTIVGGIGPPTIRVAFARGASTLEREHVDEVAELVPSLQGYQPAKIVIEGRASNDEPDPPALSEARALAVKSILVEHGIDAARFEVHALGATHPLGDETTEDGRRTDRAVVLHVDE